MQPISPIKQPMNQLNQMQQVSPIKQRPQPSQSPSFSQSPTLQSGAPLMKQKSQHQMNPMSPSSPIIPPKPNNIAQVIKQFQYAPIVGKCIVNFQFDSDNENELQLHRDEIIDLLFKTGPWWIGKRNGIIGVFPSNFAQELTDNYVGIITQNFRADREGMLSVMRGDELHVVGQSGNMYKVVKGYTVGYIPKNICTKK